MNRFFAPLVVLFIVTLLVTLNLAGCRLFGTNPGGPMGEPREEAAQTPAAPVVDTGEALVRFRVVLPTADKMLDSIQLSPNKPAEEMSASLHAAWEIATSSVTFSPVLAFSDDVIFLHVRVFFLSTPSTDLASVVAKVDSAPEAFIYRGQVAGEVNTGLFSYLDVGSSTIFILGGITGITPNPAVKNSPQPKGAVLNNGISSITFNRRLPAGTRVQVYDKGHERVLGETAVPVGLNPTVTFKLILVNVGNSNQPTTTLSKTVPVIYPPPSSTGGYAVATFTGVPVLPCIGDIHIDGGSLSGYSDLHGAADLQTGENIVDVSPKGSKTIADVLATSIELIVADATKFVKATLGLVTKVVGFISNPASPTAVTDAINGFVDSASGIVDGTGMTNGIWMAGLALYTSPPAIPVQILNNTNLNIIYADIGPINFDAIRNAGPNGLYTVDELIITGNLTLHSNYRKNDATKQQMQNFIQLARNNNLKTLAWVGGTDTVWLNPNNQDIAVKICKDLVNFVGFDGIQLDVEPLETPEIPALAALITKIRSGIPADKIVSIAAPKYSPSTTFSASGFLWKSTSDFANLAGIPGVDTVILMMYDFGTPNQDQSDYKTVVSSALNDFWLPGENSKIGIALPAYPTALPNHDKALENLAIVSQAFQMYRGKSAFESDKL